LPGLIYREAEEEFDYQQQSGYCFKIERDFGYEIQEYIQLRREIRRRKIKLLNGEIDLEAIDADDGDVLDD
jgi:hypothetical protein